MKRPGLVSMVTAVLFAIHAPSERAMAAHDAIHGIWMQAATMPAPEMSHEAVLLRDGRVMVLGGEPLLGVPVSWTQVYDPSTRSWSTSESMHFARIGFTASVLGDGRVLVVGGVDDNLNDLASAEVWTPATDTWSLLPNLLQTRFSQSASLLPDGRVLLVGGIVGGAISRSTVIFDPTSDVFVTGPPTRFPHAQACIAVLRDGRILVAGGYGGNPEVYDPHAQSWTPTGVTPKRIRPLMSSLPDGSVLLAGGTSPGGRDLRTASVFHPADNRWTDTGSLREPRNSEAGALLRDGRVLVAAGEQVDDHLLRTAELYDPGKRAWTVTAPMHVARSGATSTVLLDGTVLVCGGGDFIGALSSCETYHS
jgi:hypothetical protein